MPKLIVIDKTGNQTHFPFEKDRITIGKSPANDVVLNEAEVSREHCVIAREGAGYGVTDLNSANGVYVNGSRIRGSAGLRDGARIGVGRYLIMFRANSAARTGTDAGKDRRRTRASCVSTA